MTIKYISSTAIDNELVNLSLSLMRLSIAIRKTNSNLSIKQADLTAFHLAKKHIDNKDIGLVSQRIEFEQVK